MIGVETTPINIRRVVGASQQCHITNILQNWLS